MMQMRGVLVGAGQVEWENRQTGEMQSRPKVSVSAGVVTALPEIYDVEPEALKQAQALPFGCSVEVDLDTNRYRQVVVKAIRKAA